MFEEHEELTIARFVIRYVNGRRINGTHVYRQIETAEKMLGVGRYEAIPLASLGKLHLIIASQLDAAMLEKICHDR